MNMKYQSFLLLLLQETVSMSLFKTEHPHTNFVNMKYIIMINRFTNWFMRTLPKAIFLAVIKKIMFVIDFHFGEI